MFQKFRPFAMACLILCAALIAPQAQAQLRSDLIDAARIEKEGNLTPETEPKTERKIEWVERSLPYRLLTGEVDGFGVGFGTIVPGSGFGKRGVC